MNSTTLLKKYEKYAKEQGFKLNKKAAKAVILGLLKNKEKYNELYCPCRVVTLNKEEDKKIICPCIYHKNEIETQGHCHCNLFIKK